MGWESNYTDFLYAAYQMNIYTLWHEIRGLNRDNLMHHEEFTMLLYKEMMKMVDNAEYGARHKRKGNV